MKRILASASLLTFSVSQSFASGFEPCELDPSLSSCATEVPEINALAGIAAIAAVSAVVAFVWERRRRA